jgi:hypothetical protein
MCCAAPCAMQNCNLLSFGMQDCMVGLLFAFMPVLGHKRGAEVEDGLVARLLFRCTRPQCIDDM